MVGVIPKSEGGEGYVLGMAPEEIERLRRQHAIWREETERTWDEVGIEEGDVVLDLGCGPGFTAVDLLERVGPAGRVVAVDRSAEAIAVLRARIVQEGGERIEVIRAEAGEVDYGAIDPDVVVARWLFSFIPDPDQLVEQIATGCRVGTRIAIIDYWNYHAIHIEPSGPHFTKVFRKVYESYAEAGGSLDVGGRLPEIMSRHGIEITSVRSIGGATRPGTPYWNWITEFQRLYLPTLVEKGHLTAEEVTEHLSWWKEVEGSEGVILNLPPMVGIAGRVDVDCPHHTLHRYVARWPY